MPRLAPAWLSGYPAVILGLAALINVAAFLGFNGFGLLIPSMRDSLGLSHFQEGVLITAVSISIMTLGPISGVLASRYGTRVVVIVGITIGAIAMAFLGSAPNFPIALLMSAIMGMGLEAGVTPIMGLISVWFEPRNRGTAAGLASAGGGASFVVMGALVPWLTGRDPEDGWRHTWYFAAAIVAITVVLCVALLRDRPKGVPSVRPTGTAWMLAPYKSRVVWLLVFLALCSAAPGALHTTFFGVYLEEHGTDVATSGRLWGLMGFLGIGSAVLWGSLSDRLGRRKAFVLSFSIYAAGLSLFWLVPVLAGFLAGVVLIGLSLRAGFTIFAAASGDYVPPHLSAAVFGTIGVGAGLGRSIFPPVGGSIADATGDLGWVFALAVTAAAVGALVSAFLPPPRRLS